MLEATLDGETGDEEGDATLALEDGLVVIGGAVPLGVGFCVTERSLD